MFTLHFKQSGGCDYTCSCGEKVVILNSKTIEHANIEAANVLDEHYGLSADDLEFAKVYEIIDTEDVKI